MAGTKSSPSVWEAPSTMDLPGLDELVDIRDGVELDGPWIVILYNCECHTFDQVIDILQVATGCPVDVAEFLAFKVDSEGRAIVFNGSREECERVASIIGSIRLQVETDRA
jgi:ATP-dependent Clp protease adaptor protein ClpS